MKKYLDNTFFTFEGVTDERFYTYTTEDNKKGQVVVELSTDLSSAEVIHNDQQGNTYSYEVFNQKELQDTIEYVLGRKVVSEDQWKQVSENNQSLDVELDDWDIIN
jgi:hypothetical protein